MSDRPTIPPEDWRRLKLRSHGDRDRLFDLKLSWQDGYRHALARMCDAQLELMCPPQPPSEDEA